MRGHQQIISILGQVPVLSMEDFSNLITAGCLVNSYADDVIPYIIYIKADSRLAPSQWETSLQSNAGANRQVFYGFSPRFMDGFVFRDAS